MALNKIGSPIRLQVVKQSAFQLDVNLLASLLKDQWPGKVLSMSALHEALKSLGVTDYKAEDMQELVGRLSAVGFKIQE